MTTGPTVETLAAVRDLGAELRNWGRWGDDDQLGTLNLITDECIAAAAASVVDGTVVSCAIAFDADGPMPDRGRFNPVHTMTTTGAGQAFPGGFQYADDELKLTLQCATQWDALSHAFYDGVLYNGYPAETITMDDGASRNSIARLRARVVGRGVLLDVAGTLGIPWFDDGVAVTPEQLDQCVEAQGVEIRSGDVVLVRTGRMARVHAEGEWGPSFVVGPAPGLSIRCARWLSEREVAAIATDTCAVEVLPAEVPDCMMPFHMVALRDMGMTLGEIFDLEELAATCTEKRRHEFLFVAAPLPITGAVGSPINPLAIF